MKPCVNKCRLRLLLLLAVAFLLTMTTALAKETGKKTTSCVPLDIKDSLETVSSCKETAKPVVDQKNLDLLNELLQPDSSLLAELAGKADQPANEERTPELPR
jgi:hypothetical protein